MMKRLGFRRTGIALALAILTLVILSGCSGLPGTAGAGGQAQQGPPGLSPPPGMKTGGARTVLGTTLTAPDKYVLSVKYALASAGASATSAGAYAGAWHHCQRVLISDGIILIEGIDYDKPNATTESQSQVALPAGSITDLVWRYEPDITPPADAKSTKPADANAPKADVAPSPSKSAGK
jgi:hypothetical protein